MSTTDDTQRVRVTIDLAPDLHREMKVWVAQQGHRATLAKVYRALSDELLTNPGLAVAVLARIDQ